MFHLAEDRPNRSSSLRTGRRTGLFGVRSCATSLDESRSGWYRNVDTWKRPGRSGRDTPVRPRCPPSSVLSVDTLSDVAPSPSSLQHAVLDRIVPVVRPVGGDGREVATRNDPTSLGLEERGVSCSDLSVAVDAIGGELVGSHVPILDYRRTLVKDFL